MHVTSKPEVKGLLNEGRMLYDGVPYFDIQRAGERVTDVDQWFDFWAEAGERYERLGEEALAEGARISGGEWLWQASLSFHYAQFMWFHEPARREQGQRRKVELYNRAAPCFAPPAERIEISFEGITIPGFLRVPAGERPATGWPCVILLGGLESTKEESYGFENLCLRRGLATFAFDGPGQGELFFQLKLQPRFERYTSAVVDQLERRDEVDSGRLGVLGRSLGGFYALRSGAGDDRLRAVVAWAFFHDMEDFHEMPEHTQEGLLYVAGGSREQLVDALDLADVAADLRAPTLLLNGRNDPIFRPRQMERTIAALANAPERGRDRAGGGPLLPQHGQHRPSPYGGLAGEAASSMTVTDGSAFEAAAQLSSRPLLVGLDRKVDPTHTALVVIDVQNDFCASGGMMEREGHDLSAVQEMAASLARLLAAARSARTLVVFVRNVYSTEPNRYLSDVWLEQAARQRKGSYTISPVCAPGSWEGDFYGEVRPLPDEPVVTKHRFSAFHNTDLETVLRARAIRTVVLAGVASNVCVETTAREAFVRDYYVVFLSDGTAAYDTGAHEATLRVVDQFFGEVASIDDVVSCWERL
jgi:2,6-dihydroxypseudooxynicotine hydrolase